VQLPQSASWTHVGVRAGFEVLFAGAGTLRGHTTGREGTSSWSVGYDITVDGNWRTRAVEATNLTELGARRIHLERDSAGRWLVNGLDRPDLDGCDDVDLESSAATNTLPVHRIDLAVGEAVDVASAYIRADDLTVERLDQRYTLTNVRDDGFTVFYEAPRFGFDCALEFDATGLTVDYPGIARRSS